jgi:hypothetical protein
VKTGLQLIGDWSSAEDLQKTLHDLAEDFLAEAVPATAELLASQTKRTLAEGDSEWPALHPLTIAVKGHDQPLLDTGELAEGLNVYEVAKHVMELGYREGDRRTDGKYADVVAGVMENGATIPVNDAIRGFFAAMGFPLRADTRVLVIPARPFLQPSLDKALPEIVSLAKRIVEALVSTMS